MKTIVSSKDVLNEISDAYETHARLWRLFHAHRWLGELISNELSFIRESLLNFRPPDSSTPGTALMSRLLPDDLTVTKAEILIRCIEFDPEFIASKQKFDPLYAKLAEAQAREKAELADLERQAAELQRKKDAAEADVEVKIAEARKPVEKLKEGLRAIGNRMAELVS